MCNAPNFVTMFDHPKDEFFETFKAPNFARQGANVIPVEKKLSGSLQMFYLTR